MTDKKDTTKTNEIPDKDLYYDPRRAAEQVFNPDISEMSGVAMPREQQRDQILSAEHYKASLARAEMNARDDLDFDGIDLSEAAKQVRASRQGERSEKDSLNQSRKDLERTRTYEGEPAPDGTDHVVGVDWYNNKTVTIDDRLKSNSELEQIQKQRVEQGATPGSKKDTAKTSVETTEVKKNKDVPSTKVK